MSGNELAYLGAAPLFLGVETATWSETDFRNAARNAKNLGVTSLIIKIADGGIVWGENTGGWKNALKAVANEGIRAIPYTYSYGNMFNAMQSEINILISAMQYAGIVIADMEVEYNGKPAWGQYVAHALESVQGIFGVTTWADPSLQDWHSVLQALTPCVDFYLPQVYSDYLSGLYHKEFDPYNKPYYPVINLGTDAGPNDILGIVHGSNSPSICMWEYQSAIGAYASIVKQIVQLKKENTAMQIPRGWKYDDATKTLLAPNMTQITAGFCQWILNKDWDAGNIPLMAAVGMNPVEMGNPSIGGGTIQPFRKSVLVWTPKTDVYEMWVGQEYVALYKALNGAQTQINALQKQLQVGGVNKELLAQLSLLLANITQISDAIDTVKTTTENVVKSLDHV